MKKIFTLLILSINLNAFSFELKISQMYSETDMDRSFILRTNYPEKVALDCQSFIQGLRFGEKEEAHFFLLDPEECESLLLRIHTSLKSSLLHCIDVEREIRSDYSCS